MKADAQTAAALVGILKSFCSTLARRDGPGVVQLFAPDQDIVVATSEGRVLRGPAELKAFLAAYAQGPTTSSWMWNRHDVSTAGAVAWLLAEGTEIATSEDTEAEYQCRMTMVFVRRDGRWLLAQVHGSFPHHGLLSAVGPRGAQSTGDC